MPTENNEKVVNEKAETSLVFQVLYTWGKKEYVVNAAANKPMPSI